mmetsp:Transcript_23933/g.39048  ORF Transcript_23933/g.39048 Transcript_23933/m.39048 type:complete len:217 (+) Transcript_23933:899-1549(+)
MLSLPEHAQGVGTVLQKNGIILVTQHLDGVHVSKFSSHVRDQHMLAVRVFLKLLLQVNNINHMVSIGLHIHSLSIGMLNGRGHSSKGKGIGQNLATRLQPSGLQQQHQGRPTRVQPNTVLEASIVTDFFLTHGDNRLFTRGNVVSVESSSLHELKGCLLSFLRNRIRGLDISCDIGSVLKGLDFGVGITDRIGQQRISANKEGGKSNWKELHDKMV